MPKNIQPHKPRLLVVSDTSMYTLRGRQFAFGPVVRELEHLADTFESITWIGYEKPNMIGDPIISPILKNNIHLILLPKSGGDRLVDKLSILKHLPLIVSTIYGQLKRNDCVHTRGPSVPALIAVLLSFFFKQKSWWNKYAGNWNETNPPFFYGFQQKLLNMAVHTKVTINGKWPQQKAHLISIENPCLEEIDILNAAKTNKNITQPPYNLCFVGALNDGKGVLDIINCLNNEHIRSKIGTFYFIGDGPKRAVYQKMISDPNGILFCGFQNAKKVHDTLQLSHFILLPSKSEGFPKVIAEASCYGCIPIVSDVSCIGQYINETNGYLWNMQEPFSHLVSKALDEEPPILNQKSKAIKTLASLFTYPKFKTTILGLLKISNQL
jgi:glycosyltransferase involved in cell wall biosynthesis